ncbi:MAG: hypothetical protein K8R77_16405 [Anaerolineaceae bacterium]|nr:hypothetical protein [Anaerolineaceae bacterium]
MMKMGSGWFIVSEVVTTVVIIRQTGTRLGVFSYGSSLQQLNKLLDYMHFSTFWGKTEIFTENLLHQKEQYV